jgi:hypothetical protein
MGTGERTRDGTHSHIGNGIYVWKKEYIW